uniref:Uncharacterized protein n=1 Tax=Knipowitschia caucasica TaxID=637954 RepID=A0AAV2LK79_KNICA
MEEDTPEKEGLVLQKEIVYNALLPYADRLEPEANQLLADIKANLSRAVLVRELWPGTAFWCRKLFSRSTLLAPSIFGPGVKPGALQMKEAVTRLDPEHGPWTRAPCCLED